MKDVLLIARSRRLKLNRTSYTHPLQIAAVSAGTGMGSVGITFCPGKKQSGAMTGGWDRDLDLDLDAIRDWNAAAVVTLVEPHELQELAVPNLGEVVQQRHMAWHHLPIRDVSTPCDRFEAQWAVAGPALRHRLRSGFNVVVHCKGGLGRAGTIGARLLVELGWDPAAAIAAVRGVRPGALETSAQEEHAHSRAGFAEPEPATTDEAIRDRAVGALLGLAVGDALGTTLEFRSRDTYPLLTDIVGGGPFRLKPGQWTDDTAMALALADSLHGADDLDEHDLMQRFVAWWREGTYSCTGTCFDIGNTTRAALSWFEKTGNPIAGDSSPHAAGNGSLMRLSPVAIRWWNDADKRRDAAARQSRTTHAAPEAVDACVAYADLVAEAIAGHPTRGLLTPRDTGFSGAIGPIMAGRWRGQHRDTIRASGYVAHSLEAALWAVGRSGSFAEAVLTAANLGEDADTTAAIAGQLAGAIWGDSGIPASWLKRLAWAPRIRMMAEGLI
jgi:ADP-ribosyl-[dinitrogen reductase] hydrolase